MPLGLAFALLLTVAPQLKAKVLVDLCEEKAGAVHPLDRSSYGSMGHTNAFDPANLKEGADLKPAPFFL
jgi:hypothetical protein